jgi:hypothetical protein
MDGVIADFDAQAKAYDLYLPDGELVNNGEDLDKEWWETIPVFAGARDFYDDLTSLAKTMFLTGAKRNPGSYAGKAAWILNFVPEKGSEILYDLITCPKFQKYLLAGPNRILVDDNKAVVDRWIEAGGIGIHHKGDYAETLEAVRQAVARLKVARQPGYGALPPAQGGPQPL